MDWVDEAACDGLDTEAVVPLALPEQAREVCRTCPAIDECRAWNDRVEAGVQPLRWYGVYAGETPSERARRQGVRRRTVQAA